MLNPFIYSIRNGDIKGPRRFLSKTFSILRSTPIENVAKLNFEIWKFYLSLWCHFATLMTYLLFFVLHLNIASLYGLTWQWWVLGPLCIIITLMPKSHYIYRDSMMFFWWWSSFKEWLIPLDVLKIYKFSTTLCLFRGKFYFYFSNFCMQLYLRMLITVSQPLAFIKNI